LPELSAIEQQTLDGVKQDYLYLSRYLLPEPIVKMGYSSGLKKVEYFPVQA
jgi:hypothetical protein